MASDIPLIVSPKWLKDNLSRVKVVDFSWHMPSKNRNPKDEWEKEHIPGSRFFDLDVVATENEFGLAHMMPSEERFAEEMNHLGIVNEDIIVCYDVVGVFSSPRGWFTFKAFGHPVVAILDGGLPAWKDAGGKIESGGEIIDVEPANIYKAKLSEHFVKSYDQILTHAEASLKGKKDDNVLQLVDARSAARFTAEVSETAEGLASGHIPGSLNVPFSEILTEGFSSFKSPTEIRENMESHGVDFSTPITTTCGSGMTACHLVVGLNLCGVSNDNISMYDGSWSEYGKRAPEHAILKG